jgi:hypothetical protein
MYMQIVLNYLQFMLQFLMWICSSDGCERVDELITAKMYTTDLKTKTG